MVRAMHQQDREGPGYRYEPEGEAREDEGEFGEDWGFEGELRSERDSRLFSLFFFRKLIILDTS